MWASAHCVLCVRIASADKCVSQENVYEPHVYTTKHRNIEMRLYYAYREGRERLIAVYMGCCPIRIDNIGKCIWYTHNADSEPRTFGCLSYAFSQGIPSNANKEANDTNKQTNEPKKKKGKKIDHWLYLCIITYTHSGASHMRSMGIDVWRQVWAYWCSSIALATISRMELSHNWSACDWFRWPQNQVRMSILFSCLLNVLRSQSCAYFRLVQYVMYNTEIPVRTKPMMPEIYS